MSTTQNEIKQWLKEAKKRGATHVAVVCDTFDHSDYPVDVMPGVPVREFTEKLNRDMQRVMEVYALHLDFDQQLGEFRSFHYEYPEVET